MFTAPKTLTGSGLGLRRDFIQEVIDGPDLAVDFFEIAPENWVNLGGKWRRELTKISDRYPLVCHGLSLDLGGPHALDLDYIKNLKTFFKQHNVIHYTEHLSYCGDQGHLYDLMPIPFTEEAVKYVAQRIRTAQDILERPIGVENISFYALPSSQMSEADFVNAVITEADCALLLDVNNTYVNSVNHGYDPVDFIDAMPSERILYLHMAGHYDEASDLKIDTHGEAVNAEVWSLLEHTYQKHGVHPTLLERDFNIPPLSELLEEMNEINIRQQAQFKMGAIA